MRKSGNNAVKPVSPDELYEYSILKNKSHEKRLTYKEYLKAKAREQLIDFGNRAAMERRFIEKAHPVNTMQLETLDDQISIFTLYRLIEKPLDISEYVLQLEHDWGYSPIWDFKRMNLDVTVEQALSLLHHDKQDPMELSEILEPPVIE